MTVEVLRLAAQLLLDDPGEVELQDPIADLVPLELDLLLLDLRAVSTRFCSPEAPPSHMLCCRSSVTLYWSFDGGVIITPGIGMSMLVTADCHVACPATDICGQ